MSLPSCRFCGTPLRATFADLGLSPLANRNLRPEEIAGEKRYPLIVRVCESCLLVQADDSVPPGDIFSDYDYFSSVSASWVAHAERYVEAMQQRFPVGRDGLVVEVASNDGYLLQHYVARNVPVLGIEPAVNVAAAAECNGVPTRARFFGVETAQALVAEGKRADVMVANNVLAHVPDTRDFVAGFALLLAPQGVATFEFPHVLNLIQKVQFDTIYHEHFFYLSLHVAETILASAGLRVFDVEEIGTHGGSLRLFVCHEGAPHRQAGRVEALRAKEQAAHLDTLLGYAGFADRINRVKTEFLDFVRKAQSQEKRLAGYGAAAKGNTFLNFCGLHARDIPVIFDRSASKQGKLSPGAHIPIVDPARIREYQPDYLIILPWNIADEVRQTMAVLREWDGAFVTAVPDTRVF